MITKELLAGVNAPDILISFPEEISTIIVHDGRFHADDVFCVAFLKECFMEDIKIKRISRNTDIEKYNAYDNIICDVGGIYDGQRFFDHHMFNGSRQEAHQLRSAFGLLWDAYGNKTMYPKLDNLVSDINKHDGDCSRFRSQLCVAISCFNPAWDAPEASIHQSFDAAVDVARNIIKATIVSDINNMRATYAVSNNSYIDNSVLFLNTRAPYDHLIPTQYKYCKMTARYSNNEFSLRLINGWRFPKTWLEKSPYSALKIKTPMLASTNDRTLIPRICKSLVKPN